MKKLTVSLSRKESILGWIFFAFQLTGLQILMVFVNGLLPNPLSSAELNFAFFCINFLCTVLIMHKFLLRSAKVALSSLFRCLRFAFFGFLMYWGSSIVFGVLISLFYPQFFNVNDNSIGQLTQDNYTLMAVGTVLLVPVAEELLYRGLIFSKLYNRSRAAAYIVSTVAFSALHVLGYIGQYEPMHLLLCFIQYVPAAIALCWSYAKADTIWAPILIHITINQIAILTTR